MMRCCAVVSVLMVGGMMLRADERKPASIREQLLDADRRFAAEVMARGLEGWMDFMSEDAVRLPKLGGTAVKGKAEIRESDAMMFADPKKKLKWDPTEAGEFDGGASGFTTGTFQMVAIDDDGKETIIGRGRYLTWWRRDRDGKWRVILDTGEPDPPPAR